MIEDRRQIHAGSRPAYTANAAHGKAPAASRIPPHAAEYAADIDREERKWGALVRKLGLKVE
jgi:hypothetical protein